MLKKIGYIILLSALSLVSSCGSDGDDVAVITYVVTVSRGNIAQIVYLDGNGQEVQTAGTPGRLTYTTNFGAKSGTFLFLQAVAETPGEATVISARILSNGVTVGEGSTIGADAEPAPQISLEAFATIPDDDATSTE